MILIIFNQPDGSITWILEINDWNSVNIWRRKKCQGVVNIYDEMTLETFHAYDFIVLLCTSFYKLEMFQIFDDKTCNFPSHRAKINKNHSDDVFQNANKKQRAGCNHLDVQNICFNLVRIFICKFGWLFCQRLYIAQR